MSVSFRQVERDEEVEALAHMAHHIWNEYWPALIGQEQTDYMVEKFQSLNAFRADIADNGYEYFFIMDRENATPRAPAGADDAVESDRDGELAHDAEDFAHEAAKPRIIGYTGGRVEADTNRFFVSKVYLLKEHRGRGLIASVVRFYERLCCERGLDAMYLTVNKKNEMAIRAYKKHGFEIIDAVETDIGEGFVMNDYIMEKKLK